LNLIKIKLKKTLIHIFQYKFTNHDFKSREYDELEKKFKIKVIVHDLSKIFYSDLTHIKAKNFKNSIKFTSLSKWLKTLDKLKKKNVTIVNELSFDSFKSLIIHYYLKKSNIPMIMDINAGVIDASDFSTKKLSLQIIWIKIKKIFNNINLLLYFLKKKFLNILFFFIKFKKISIVLAGVRYTNLPFRSKNKKIIRVHSRDYSNFLIYKKINKIKKKPIIFLDAPLPYVKGDEEFLNDDTRVIDVAQWYKEHNIFFDKLENIFSTKVIIVPHPKMKGVKNPFFKKRFVDHRLDAALKLTPSSLFVISGIFVSTAISFAIAGSKPIFFIYSDQMKSHYEKNVIFEKDSAKLIGSGVLDINNFKKENILKNMKVNARLYNNYKYRFLTSKQLSKKPNHVILGKII
jgi:hypothetical protein